ncbi:MAG: cytochrome C biogenesis protein [Anaerolineae bacterium]|nr:cytochrome C biogenesis protein [Anaerolineae bacterium]
MEAEGVKVTVAFLAGVASFASPCVLPLVPAYLGMLAGLGMEGWAARRGQVLLHAVLFVLGFSLLFVISGAAATALGRALSRQLPWLQRVGGLALVLLGLHLIGVVRIPFLARNRSLSGSAKPGAGYLASFLTGMFLFAGWVPCVGPVLMSIYMLAGGSDTVGQGIGLLGAYSLGLGLPFLVVALFADWVIPRLRRLGRAARWVEILSGLLVIAVGLAIMFDALSVLARYGSFLGMT